METTHDTYLIADTSGLISLAVTTDSNHDAAIAATNRLQGKHSTILVPYEVFMETVNVLGKRFGHVPACAIAAYLATTPLFLIVDSSKEVRTQALERFETQPQVVSFTDCVVMTVADEYHTRIIFGFDRDHARNGYIILTAKSSQAA